MQLLKCYRENIDVWPGWQGMQSKYIATKLGVAYLDFELF